MVETRRLLALRPCLAAGLPLIGDGRTLFNLLKSANE